jgi:hypothetical protein
VITESDDEEVINLNELFERNESAGKKRDVKMAASEAEPRRARLSNDEDFSIILSSVPSVASDINASEPDDEQWEVVPERYRPLEASHANVRFIDDGYVVKDGKRADAIFDKNELERITSDIVEVIEGKTILLREAEIEEDKELVAHVLTGIAPAFEDLLLEFEDDYKYIDEEIDFIHTMLTEDDYPNYIKYIDEYHGITLKKDSTTAIELMGLNHDEISGVEERLFADEYKNVNLYEVFDFFRGEYSGPDGKTSIAKECTYILPSAESLLAEERSSIERDITSGTALVFEEDVDDIRDQYIKIVGAEKAQKVNVIDEVYDITDKVVIIEDEYDIDQFVREFPGERQPEVKKLLKYLDGLFEKLPRETLKKFVNSEYFDLYIKVLTEMGV